MSGWKDWAIGEVVTESEFQSFVQDQVVQVYDDATDRDNTLGANVAEGMMCYLKDIDETQVYDGTDWVSTVGDITEVVAGTALTGGGTSGSVTLNVDESEIEIDPDQVNGTAVVDNDSRLTDARTPTSHASTHESGGTDEIEIAQSQVTDLVPSILDKADYFSVIFTKTGNGTAEIKAGTKTSVDGQAINFATDTAITMPSLTAGTDYFVYAIDDGTAEAVAATGTWPTPVSSPPANSRLIGGFHYAPGGNATAQSGGNTTPQINEYSFWDLKFRPSATDPRGMTLVSDAFWVDIYLLNTDPQTNGTSKYNVTIADGIDPAIIPDAFGGNGSATYSGQTWWNTSEALSAFGKRCISVREASVAFYGTTEESSAGSDPVSTILREDYTSKWGVMLSTGNMWEWGNEFGGGAGPSSYEAITGGRGSVFLQANPVILGGNWSAGSDSGSRGARWTLSPSHSGSSFGGRGACDHLLLV